MAHTRVGERERESAMCQEMSKITQQLMSFFKPSPVQDMAIISSSGKYGTALNGGKIF